MSSVKYWVSLIVLLSAIYGSLLAWRKYQRPQATAALEGSQFVRATPVYPSQPLPPFMLTDQDGKPFDSKSLAGKVWVGSFFFVSCPAICWRMNQALADVQLSAPGDQVRYISITSDPDTDTPEVLTRYAEKLHADPARWTFLTGSSQAIEAVGLSMLVAAKKEAHSSKAIVVDGEGRMRGHFNLTEPDEVKKMKKLLAELVASSE
jgi:protein SCO1